MHVHVVSGSCCQRTGSRKEMGLLLGWRSYACRERQSMGFLLNPENESWQIACLWTGGDSNATCAPAPIVNKRFAYMEPAKWQALLRVSDIIESLQLQQQAIYLQR